MLSLMWSDQVFQETATFLTDETGLLAFRFYSAETHLRVYSNHGVLGAKRQFNIHSRFFVITPSFPVQFSLKPYVVDSLLWMYQTKSSIVK